MKIKYIDLPSGRFKLKKENRREITPLGICMTVLFSIYVFVSIYPFIYAFLVTIQPYKEFASEKQLILPITQDFAKGIKNYITAWTEIEKNTKPLYMLFLNSAWFAFGSVFINLLCSSMTAYVVAKYKFFGRRFIYVFAIITMMIPVIGATASQLQYVNSLGGYNSPLYVLIMGVGIGGSFIIMYATFKGVDWGYAEAAFIDGAGHFTIFFAIMLPQVIAPLCAIGVTDFISFWGDGDTALMFFPELPTLATGIYKYAYGNFKAPILFAIMFMALVPTLVLFLIFKNSLMEIQLGGGLKG